ncbi:MAG: DUF4013 domain-containing protein [Nanoarchaeota archaeon]
MATIGEALKYPFANFKRVFNYWWILIPIWGWFVVSGYGIRIINTLVNGNTKELPAIRPFTGLFRTGFFAVVTWLTIAIITGLFTLIPVLGWIVYAYIIFIAPLLMFQFAEQGRIRDGFNVLRASKTMFSSFGRYLVAYVKTIVVGIVFLLASILIITLIVTLPAISFSQYFFFAEYYKQYGKTTVTKKK